MQMITEPFEHARKREVNSYSFTRTVRTHRRQAMGSSAPAMAIELLRSTKDVDDLSRLQLLKDTCATAFVGKLNGEG